MRCYSGSTNYLPLSRDGRAEALEILNLFETGVNEYVRTKDGKTDGLPEQVLKYGQGIRASTDLGSRKRRHEGLGDVLSCVWQR